MHEYIKIYIFYSQRHNKHILKKKKKLFEKSIKILIFYIRANALSVKIGY